MVVPNSQKKEQTLLLIAEKDRIEHQINDFGKVLKANKDVGMTGNLVDDEGFPRSDIDVYQVRHARQQIICLQNDLKELMKQIAKGIEEVHAEAAAQQSFANPKTSGMEEEDQEVVDAGTSTNNNRAFIKVNMVFPGSPAEEAGLAIGDEIFEFGSINSSNFKTLATIGEVVKHRQNQRIPLKVKRGEIFIDMNLIPRPWSGRGLLGCNIVLPDTIER